MNFSPVHFAHVTYLCKSNAQIRIRLFRRFRESFGTRRRGPADSRDQWIPRDARVTMWLWNNDRLPWNIKISCLSRRQRRHFNNTLHVTVDGEQSGGQQHPERGESSTFLPYSPPELTIERDFAFYFFVLRFWRNGQSRIADPAVSHLLWDVIAIFWRFSLFSRNF